MTKYRIYPYKQGSASAKKLAEALEGKVLKHVGSKYKPRLGDVVVNWGSGAPPAFAPATTLNPDVGVAQCKLATFGRLQGAGVRVPQWDVDKGEASHFGFPVVCRTKLRGHSGDGIVIANNADELVDAPLYTKYVKKKDEYRVHTGKHGTIFVQRKARKLGEEKPNWSVRNLVGGFVFVEPDLLDQNDDRDDLVWDYPKDVRDQAVAALDALGLDFGGVDVLFNAKEQKAYVLEVNTACGLEPRTAERYANYFRKYLDT